MNAWGASWGNSWGSSFGAASVVASVATSSGGRFFAWVPDYPKKKKKPVVEVGVTTDKQKVSVRYFSAPEQPRFPIEVLQSVQEIISKNNYRRSELLRKIEEAEEEENILIILSELN